MAGDSRHKFKTEIKIAKNKTSNKKTSYKWVITIIIWTFVISASLQTLQAGLMKNVDLIIAFIILILIILIGIVFDIIGVAVTAASEVPFHSLASRKVRGAKQAIALIRNADKVGNFCNDVIGDIAGIISGSATTAIVVSLMLRMPQSNEFLLTIILAGMVAAVTVGGKALGKAIAISNCNSIIFTVGKVISLVKPIKKVRGQKNESNNK